jgi:hypothetical protein
MRLFMRSMKNDKAQNGRTTEVGDLRQIVPNGTSVHCKHRIKRPDLTMKCVEDKATR